MISVDTKKKEKVGEFKNGGREWRPKGEPAGVRTHDFPDEQLGKAIPYGVYDLAAHRFHYAGAGIMGRGTVDRGNVAEFEGVRTA